MKPAIVTPTLPPDPSIAPTVSKTDQQILEENTRVATFQEIDTSELKRRTFIEFFGQNKQVLITAILACLIIFGSTFFAVAKFKLLTKIPIIKETSLASKIENTVSGDSGSDSTGGSTTPEDSTSEDDTAVDGEAETTSDDSSGDDYTDDSETTEEEEYYEEDPGEEEGEETGEEEGEETPVVTVPPTPVPVTPSPTTPHKFTVASWNIHSENKLMVGDQLPNITKSSQIVGLQELYSLAQRSSLKSKTICSSCSFAGYVPSYTTTSTGAASYPIIWNKSAFTATSAGSWKKIGDSLTVGSTSYAPRYATWIKLKSRVNGKEFYVVNTRFISAVDANGKPSSNTAQIGRYKTNMSNLVSIVNELKKSNVPIYVTGSFYVDYRYDKNGYTSYFPYLSMKSLGLRSGWDVMNLSGISSTTGTGGSSSKINEYIFVWQRSDIATNGVAISGARYGSDTSPIFMTTTVK